MIKLKEIKRSNNFITCLAFVEDAPNGIKLSFDEQKKQLNNEPLPKGYEYCEEHLAHADLYLESLVGKEITNRERTIMWY